MKTISLTFIAFWFNLVLLAQSPSLSWVFRNGSSGPERGRDLAADANGNTVSTGYFSNTVDFDPGTGTANLTADVSTDMFIQKFNSAGNFVWVKQIGGVDNITSTSIATDASGNVYVTGSFGGSFDFDPGSGTATLTAQDNQDVFILKLNSSGNYVWAKKISGIDVQLANAINVDFSGNVLVTGYFQGVTDFDPGSGTVNLTNIGAQSNVFILKLSSSGNYVWAKQIGGTDGHQGSGIAADASGNVYVTGFFGGTSDFDPGSGQLNLTSVAWDAFTLKLTSTGSFGWVWQSVGTSDDKGNDIRLDASGNVITVGGFKGICDFDPGPGTYNLTGSGGEDIFVQKLSSSGNFIWARRIGGTSGDRALNVTVDGSGNVIFSGTFDGTVDFDPGPGTVSSTSVGVLDIFLEKLDPNGNFLWAGNIGGNNLDENFSVSADASGNIYATGYFNNTADFDPGINVYNLTSNGSSDFYVMKLGPTATGFAESDIESPIKIFPNPVRDIFTIDLLDLVDVTLIISDMTGQIVYKTEIINESKFSADLNIAKGCYLIEIITVDKKFTRKLLVN